MTLNFNEHKCNLDPKFRREIQNPTIGNDPEPLSEISQYLNNTYYNIILTITPQILQNSELISCHSLIHQYHIIFQLSHKHPADQYRSHSQSLRNVQ